MFPTRTGKKPVVTKLQSSSNVRVERFSTNPLITAASSPMLGDNICGPSVIRVPDWLPNPLARYYMYFAHHTGTYIRLAYADEVQGPWHIHEPGTLQLHQAEAFQDHIASPDVHLDEDKKYIRMYFHGPAKARPGQWTGVATSEDGLHFTSLSDLLGKFYFRIWSWQGHWYALAKNNNEGWGELYRSPHSQGPFELRGNFLKGMRHSAVLVDGHNLQIFYSRVGDAPERIMMAEVDMREDWCKWTHSEPVEILQPETAYEGVGYAIQPSIHGSSIGVNQLRDPYIIEDEGKEYIFYTNSGEMGVCGGELYEL